MGSPALIAAVGTLPIWLSAAGGGLAQTPGVYGPVAVDRYLNGAFPSMAPGTTAWTTSNAFPNLTFVDPIWFAPYPGQSNRVMVAEKTGRIFSFEQRPDVTPGEMTAVLDLTAAVETSEDQGFYQFIFHPDFVSSGSSNRYLYVCYSHRYLPAVDQNDDTYWRLARFTIPSGDIVADPNSETVLISQFDPHRWHQGGAMFFDSEGFLYVTTGDGGDSNDSFGYSQKIDFGLFGGAFRIDVDTNLSRSHPIRRQPQDSGRPGGWPPSFTQNYTIPDSNPFVQNPPPPQGQDADRLEEFFALGLRSPHTMHYDAVSRQVWIGDVGQGSREEMDLMILDPGNPFSSTNAPNFQWSYREGNIAGPVAPPTTILGAEYPPIHDYDRTVGQAVIGGPVYRGAQFASELGGRILFGDHVQGRIWAMTYVPGLPPIPEELAGFTTGNKAGMANFCEDAVGEIFIPNLNGTDNPGGIIETLVAAGQSAEPPALLSQTGAFLDTANLIAAPFLLPYTVNTPLWSDRAAKARWISLPNDGARDTTIEQISFTEAGDWSFPLGTVFVKHFELPVDERYPWITTRLETRFLVIDETGGKYGVTYRWLPDQSDAVLLTTGEIGDYSVVQPDGIIANQTWPFPSRGDCLLCHNAWAGQALGVRTHQLHGDFRYPPTGRTDNQLRTWNALGMFDQALSISEIARFLPSVPFGDGSVPLEHRVRSYLDANCAHCHRPGAIGGTFDARLPTPLIAQNIVNAPLERDFDLGPDDAVIKPQDVAMSAIHARLNAAIPDPAAMPPLAKNVIHADAVQAVADWILSLAPQEFDLTGGVTGRYLRFVALSELNGYPWASMAEFNVLNETGGVIPQTGLTLIDYDSEELVAEFAPASNLVDGNPATFWHTEWLPAGETNDPPFPHWFILDLGSVRPIGGFSMLPRQDNPNGRIQDWRLEVGDDGTHFVEAAFGQFVPGTAEQVINELTGSRPLRALATGPGGQTDGDFQVTFVLDADATDFDPLDLAVINGTVLELQGTGYYYVATVRPQGTEVSVQLPQDALAGPGGHGNLPSAVLNVSFDDDLRPAPVFTGIPAFGWVSGPFSIQVEFGEAVNGLDTSDFSVVNGTLDGLSGSGGSYVLDITPTAEGTVFIEILDGAVMDTAGNPMGPGTLATVTYVEGGGSQMPTWEAESGSLMGGMAVVNDAGASGGAYVWLPDGAYPNNWQTLNIAHRVEYTVNVPFAGMWTLQGLVQSSDTSSDSFWVEFGGNSGGGTVYVWDTNEGAVGNPNFAWDDLSDRSPPTDPVVVSLVAGSQLLTVYGRDDGTRLDALRLIGGQSAVRLSGPSGPVTGPFSIGVMFSSPVTGLETGDFVIVGGSVTAVAGSGSVYTAIVSPTGAWITVSLPQDAALDGAMNGTPPSNPVTVLYLPPFDGWRSSYRLTAAELLLTSDDDGDGVLAVFEYLFNLDPLVADAHGVDPSQTLSPAGPSGLPIFSVVDGSGGPRLQVEFLRRKEAAAAGYVIAVQMANDLTRLPEPLWTDAPEFSVSTINAEWDWVTVQDPSPSNAVRFARINLSVPPSSL